MCNRFITILRFVAVALVLLLSSNVVTADGKRSNVHTWLKKYTLAPADARMVSRVYEIFEDVKNASDSIVHPSKLYIIESKSTPWAIALEDGNIILTTGAIDVIYNHDGSLYEQDARMAFVLGHELKHVIEDDFSHQRAYLALTESADSAIFQSSEDQATDRRALELSADEEGLIHASLAGYDTSAIFVKVASAANFLEHWAEQTHTISGSQYASPQERTDYLRKRYENIEIQVEFFRYGVRLAHFGDYENARVLLEDFYKIYESDRVLTNRGYVHLQLARADMDEALAYRFWFPDLLDLDSGFPVSVSRSMDPKMSIYARTHFEKAVKLLSKALNSSGNDMFTRMNLITAYLFLGEYSAARAVLEKVDNWDKQPQLLGLDAIITMQDKRLKNPWDSHSLELVNKLAGEPDAPHNLIYNYARILQENERPDQARPYWTKLAEHLSALPKNYQVMVCRELPDRHKCVDEIELSIVEQAPFKLSVKPGENINSKKTRKRVNAWNTKPIDSFSGIGAKIYTDNKGWTRLVIDSVVKLATVAKLDTDTQELLDVYGEPNQIVNTGSEQIWSYGPSWSALVMGNKVKELWVAQ